MISSRDLINALQQRLALRWVAGNSEIGASRVISRPTEDKRHETLAGPLNYIHPNRLQIIGHTELAYLNDMSPASRADAIERLFAACPAAVILSDDIEPDDSMISAANNSNTPLLVTPVTDSQLLAHLQYYLSIELAEHVSMHGVFLEVLGMGVLLTGDAAVGKSELALELITRGHRLVADDAPEFSRIAPDIISGACPPLLQDFLEVRGLGVINVRSMFGDSAIKRHKYLRLVVRLQRMDHTLLTTMDRLTGSYSTRQILGLEIPEVTVPVAPGRNLAILVEAAVRNHMLRLQGQEGTEEFIQRQRRAIDANTPG